jgi:hypothetical protein
MNKKYWTTQHRLFPRADDRILPRSRTSQSHHMYQVISFFFSWLAATKSKKCSSLLFPRSQEEAAYSWSSLQWIRNPKTDRSKRKKNYAGKLPCQNEKQTWHENWKKLRQFSKNADLNASVVSFEKEQIDGRQVRPLLGDNKRWITPKINIKIISQASKKQRSHLGWIGKKIMVWPSSQQEQCWSHQSDTQKVDIQSGAWSLPMFL